jgi:hypothetical protein
VADAAQMVCDPLLCPLRSVLLPGVGTLRLLAVPDCLWQVSLFPATVAREWPQMVPP